MNTIDFFAILIVVSLLVLTLLSRKSTLIGAGSFGYPYELEEKQFSPAERSFLGGIDQAVGTEYRVLGKVRIADLAKLKPGLSNSTRQAAINRIGSKHPALVT